MTLLESVTANGKFYFLDGKRVSRETAIAAKFQKRLDCFVTRVTPKAVKNYCCIS